MSLPKKSAAEFIGATDKRAPAGFAPIALQQLWLFWLAPLIGAALGGIVYRWFED